jgi:hypothetical protein
MNKNPDPGAGVPAETPEPSSPPRKPEAPKGPRTSFRASAHAEPRAISASPEKTLIIPHEDAELAESATDSLDPEEGMGGSQTEAMAAEGVGLPGQDTGTPGDTEEVLVLLPDDGSESLPVVETMVVEDRTWEAGPTTTDVLKDVPADLSPRSPTNVSLEDVPLMKVNPVSLAEGKTEDLGSAGPTGSFKEGGKGEDEEIKVIDEIADIAADLDQEESLSEEPRPLNIPQAMNSPDGLGEEQAPAGSRRIRLVALLSSIAAVILVGVFFYPDLELLYRRFTGGENGGSVAHAGGQPRTGGESGRSGADSGAMGREDLRTKVHLAMQIGLRADAGKE